jgi:hypothetical protein
VEGVADFDQPHGGASSVGDEVGDDDPSLLGGELVACDDLDGAPPGRAAATFDPRDPARIDACGRGLEAHRAPAQRGDEPRDLVATSRRVRDVHEVSAGLGRIAWSADALHDEGDLAVLDEPVPLSSGRELAAEPLTGVKLTHERGSRRWQTDARALAALEAASDVEAVLGASDDDHAATLKRLHAPREGQSQARRSPAKVHAQFDPTGE